MRSPKTAIAELELATVLVEDDRSEKGGSKAAGKSQQDRRARARSAWIERQAEIALAVWRRVDN